MGSFLDRLKYPHKRSAIPYFFHDPRLFFGIGRKPSKLHVSSAIERAMEVNIVEALLNFLPQRFLDHLEKADVRDTRGCRLMLYLLVRKYKPEVVVETGVAQGLSSAYILCAMQENNRGHLYSIDLPAESAAADSAAGPGNTCGYELPDGQVHSQYEVGYFVPDFLRELWTLTLGDARRELPSLLQRLGRIDVFYHDSLHTYEHMKFEYEAAWPYIADGGLLLSDDVLWSRAFHELCKQRDRKAIIYRTLGILKK